MSYLPVVAEKYLITRTFGIIPITNDQSEKILKIMNSDIRHISVDGEVIACSEIKGIATQAKAEEIAHRAVGEWQCQFKRWHGKQETYCPGHR
jgi:hypothetical protein